MSLDQAIYVVIHKDRHIDTQAYPCSTPEKAIALAEKIVSEYEPDKDLHEDDATMSPDDLAEAEWIYYRCYSTEGDRVWITKAVLDGEQDAR